MYTDKTSRFCWAENCNYTCDFFGFLTKHDAVIVLFCCSIIFCVSEGIDYFDPAFIISCTGLRKIRSVLELILILFIKRADGVDYGALSGMITSDQ